MPLTFLCSWTTFSVTVMTLITSPLSALSHVDDSVQEVTIHAKNSAVQRVVNASFRLRT